MEKYIPRHEFQVGVYFVKEWSDMGKVFKNKRLF